MESPEPYYLAKSSIISVKKELHNLTMVDKRNISLDFVKGCCVIGMTLGHAFNYFAASTSIFYHHMRFISGSFIFITGFIITNIYPKKYDLSENRKKISLRLIRRGIKLLLLVSFINIILDSFLYHYIEQRNYTIPEYLYTVYVSGDYKIISFELLYIIAYLLLFLGIMVFILGNRLKFIIPLIIIIALYCSTVLYYQKEAFNLRYLTFGLLGAAFGFIPINKLNALYNYKYIYVIVCIPILFILTFTPQYYPIYTLNILINLLLFYIIGLKVKPDNSLVKKTLLLANYSLLAYLFQMSVLKVLKYVLFFLSTGLFKAVLSSAITLICTYIFIYIVNYLNVNSNIMRKFYRIIFA